MASEVSICNQALSWLGHNQIISLDDETPEARICKANYAELRDSLLEAFDWTFAVAREKWPKDPTAPSFGYGNRFPIPSKCIRIINVTSGGGPEIDWQAEGGYIVTDESTIEVRFIQRITNVALMSPMFRQTLAARLGAEIAEPLTSSRSMMQSMFELFDRKLEEAVASDGMQGKARRLRSRWLHRVR